MKLARRSRPEPAGRKAGRADGPPALWLGQAVRLWPAEEHAGVFAHPRGLYGGRGDRAGDLRFLPQPGHQPETALRPDRGDGVHHPAARRARSGPTPWACPRPASRSRSPTTARCSIAGRAPSSNITRTPKAPRPPRTPKAGSPPAMRASSRKAPAICGSSTAPRMWARMADGAMFAPKYVENKLKFFPNILEAVVFGQWPRLLHRLHQHRPERGRQLGRTQQHRLCVLSGTGRAPAGLCDRSRAMWKR